jgi:hypothetical protein
VLSIIRSSFIACLLTVVPLTIIASAYPRLMLFSRPLPDWVILGLALMPLVAAATKARQSHVAYASIPLAILLFSDSRNASYSFLFDMWRTGFLVAGCALAMLVSLWPRTLGLLALSVPVVGAIGIALETKGAMLFSDDHPAFMYRIMQLKEEFPLIPFYNPLWNAGVDAREFFPSGSLGLFFLFAPLWYLAEIEAVFTPLVITLLFLVTPVVMWRSAWRLGLEPSAQALSVLIGTLPNLLWYRFALSYGTLGFVVSSIFLVLAVAASARVLVEDSRSTWAYLVEWCVALSLCVFWPLMSVALLPLVIFGVIRFPHIFAHNRRVLVASGALALFHIPWMTLFLTASKVTSFVSNPTKGAGRVLATDVIVTRLREIAHGLNPLILAGATPAIPQFVRLRGGGLVVVSAIWTTLLGLVGPFFAPHLELERFLLPSSMLWALVSAVGFAQLLPCVRPVQRTISYPLQVLVGVLVCTVIAYAPVLIYRIAANQSKERYLFASPLVGDIRDAIIQYAGAGRTLFAGFILHELNGGHVAPLAAMTQRPLIASRYQHDRWTYEDVIPEEYRARGEAGVLEFLDLHNVSLVITHERNWSRWFSARTAQFEQVAQYQRFRFFKRRSASPGYFLEGSGEVLAQTGSVVSLRVDSPSAVVKFNYLPWLEASGCEVSPEAISPPVVFVRLSQCRPGEVITLRAVDPFRRLFKYSPAS